MIGCGDGAAQPQVRGYSHPNRGAAFMLIPGALLVLALAALLLGQPAG